MLRAASIRDPDDETLYGDAIELIEAGITDIHYVDDGVAAVALAHDGYVFECGLTAAELRSGLTAEQRASIDGGACRRGPAGDDRRCAVLHGTPRASPRRGLALRRG